ncbi:hypothetical protein ACTQZS_14110 [Bilifractor sp. LCP19S3_H10]|uniref:hypothetical protein n=1 Tax=Bilifractor sp. LCP19S3_H10 TaxID=3438736 RepID=UPI003F93494F
MTIEITSATIISRYRIEITAIDCSEENLQKMERLREDNFEKEIYYVFDKTANPKALYAARNWLQKQSATAKAGSWADALNSIVGIVTDSYGIGKYRVVE